MHGQPDYRAGTEIQRYPSSDGSILRSLNDGGEHKGDQGHPANFPGHDAAIERWRLLSHSLFPASLYEPAVHRVGRKISQDHPDLHHEPISGVCGMKMRMRKEDEEGQGSIGIFT